MTRTSFIVRFFVLLAIQLVLMEFCRIGPFILISILPAMILCIPTARPTWWTLIVAFLAGLAVDGLVDGPLGLNAAALLVVGVIRKPLIRFFIGEDLVERNYNFSFHSNGIIKIGITLAVTVAVYFTIYVILDSAGTYSFGFNATKGLASSAVSLVFGLPVVEFLSPYQRR